MTTATWVVFHDASDSYPEFIVEEVKEEFKETNVKGALSISNKGCLVAPGNERAEFGHRICLLKDAPKNVRDAYKAGEIKTIKWPELWTPIT